MGKSSGKTGRSAKYGASQPTVGETACCSGCAQGDSVPQGGTDPSYDQAFERALLRAAARQKELIGDRAAADRALDDLERLDGHRQELLLRNSRRLTTFAALERFLDSAVAAVATEPEVAISWARRALALAPRLDPLHYGQALLHDSEARAWTIWAQAARVLGRLDEADEALRRAYQSLLRGTRDPVERATWLEARAELRVLQGEVDQAASFHRRAAELFREAGEENRAAGCFSALARLHRESGQPERAVAAARQALSLAPSRLTVRFSALFELAEALLACGNFFAARGALDEMRRLGADGVTSATANELANRIDRALVPRRALGAS